MVNLVGFACTQGHENTSNMAAEDTLLWAETEAAGWEERRLCPLSAVAALELPAKPPTTGFPAVPLLLWALLLVGSCLGYWMSPHDQLMAPPLISP